MILFRSLHLENFHLARDLTIPFSSDRSRPLSLIRAEPGTGKTTVFRAFRWVLYDAEGLPNGGKGYPLGSMAHNTERDGPEIEISATIEFEVDEGHAEPTVYRLRRSARELVAPDGSHSRSGSQKVLMRLRSSGWQTVDHPEIALERFFPSALRDVFFTDGDEAMRFIAKDVSTSTKRERVRGAIRNLLGINTLEDAEGHLDSVATQFNAEVKNKGGNVGLKDASERVERLTSGLDAAVKTEDDLARSFQRIDEERSTARERLDAALQRGNRTELRHGLRDAEATQGTAQSDIGQVHREKSDLLRTKALAMPFLKPAVESARTRLAALKSEGAIPSDYLPLLRERLDVGRCVCGTELVPGSAHREAIEKLLKDHEATSAIKDRLTALYYVTSGEESADGLAVQLGRLEARLNRSQKQHAAAGARIRALELQISQLGDSDIEALQASYKDNEMALRKVSEERVIAAETVKSLRRQLDEATKARDKLLENEKDAKAIQAKLLVANDIRQVISRAKDRIQDEKLKEVSGEMDLLFRRMIGSDAENALIKSAQITSDFDVVVFSQTGARLDPDLQLNGAARRAITLAFILALAKVSGFRSPNVIDTPLGMMGIQVKQAALATVVQESAQPILFLTYAEIRDIEDALDQYAGSKVTLTMTAHFPTYLRNQPPVEGPEILRCDCGHRDHCELCERVFTTADVEEAVA